MSANERRALYYSAVDEHDPYVQVDINEYLIENWPVLNLKQRKCIWTLCQNDEDFVFDEIHDQIDAHVFAYAESDDSVVLPSEDESDEEETDSCLLFDVFEYISDSFELDDEKVNELTDQLIDDDGLLSTMASYIDDYVFMKTNCKPIDDDGLSGDVESST